MTAVISVVASGLEKCRPELAGTCGKMSNTSRASPFLLFIGKERSNMRPVELRTSFLILFVCFVVVCLFVVCFVVVCLFVVCFVVVCLFVVCFVVAVLFVFWVFVVVVVGYNRARNRMTKKLLSISMDRVRTPFCNTESGIPGKAPSLPHVDECRKTIVVR